MRFVDVDGPSSSPHGADVDLEWVKTIVLRERPLGKAVSSDTQTNGRISYLHLMLRLCSDARGVESRGTLLRSFIFPGSRNAL